MKPINLFIPTALLGSIPFAGCLHVKTDPIKVEPIYIEITVNHRIQQELDDFFSEIDQASSTTEYEPLEEPSTPAE
jgi:hypothetical protein